MKGVVTWELCLVIKRISILVAESAYTIYHEVIPSCKNPFMLNHLAEDVPWKWKSTYHNWQLKRPPCNPSTTSHIAMGGTRIDNLSCRTSLPDHLFIVAATLPSAFEEQLSTEASAGYGQCSSTGSVNACVRRPVKTNSLSKHVSTLEDATVDDAGPEISRPLSASGTPNSTPKSFCAASCVASRY